MVVVVVVVGRLTMLGTKSAATQRSAQLMNYSAWEVCMCVFVCLFAAQRGTRQSPCVGMRFETKSELKVTLLLPLFVPVTTTLDTPLDLVASCDLNISLERNANTSKGCRRMEP